MALKVTNQNGAWGTGSTWVGGAVPATTDTVQIDHAVTTSAGTTTIARVLVNSSGSLTFPAGSSSKLILNNGNFELRGLLTMKPNSVSIVHEIQFINIVESNFVGGGNVILETDIGLWVLAGGRVDLQGTTKKPWTNTTTSVAAGATSMTVADASGWQIGDVIVICPTSEPDISGLDYDGINQLPIDPYMNQFERRTLTSVSGNTVGWSGGLLFSHNSVTSNIAAGTYPASNKTWMPEVGNLTRNVKIGGESVTKRTHILFKNTITAQQNIQYVEMRWMGPRKIDPDVHPDRITLVQGRYALHFHHCDDFTANSLVYGCSIYDCGNRCYVLHNSNHITMSNNVAHYFLESAFWWDEGHFTHFATWEDNLMAGHVHNGSSLPAKQITMQLLKGDGNIARRNVIVYGSQTNLHGAGAYSWEANSEGVWIFEDNLCHSTGTGLWVWQNTTLNHTIIRYDSYHCTEAIAHGAYTNSYQYIGGHHYKSLIFIEATSITTNGVVFKDIYMDAGGEDYCLYIIESPVGGTPENVNKFIQCIMKNYAVAGIEFRGSGPGTGSNAVPKYIDIVNCDIGANNGSEYVWDGTLGVSDGSTIRLQRIGSGVNTKREHINQTTIFTSGIPDFAPNTYGNGLLGLQGDYYNGNGFTDYKFSRFDSVVAYDVWRPDVAINSEGVHHLVTSADPNPSNPLELIQTDATYSIKWAGRLQTFEAGNYNFRIRASGKARMYFNDGGGEDLVIDEWAATSDIFATSPPSTLLANTQYSLRLEFQNNAAPGTSQGFVFEWKSPNMANYQIVPVYQLFGPTTNSNPTASAGVDQTINLPTSSVSLTAIGSFDIDGTIASYAWTRISGPNTPTIQTPSARDTTVGAAGTPLIAGTYVFRVTVTDDDAATATDDVTITVNAANSLPIVNAGSDQSIVSPGSAFLVGTASDPDGSITGVLWTKDSGGTANILSPTSLSTEVSGLTVGSYTFRLTATDNSGGQAFDQVLVSVTAPNNILPVANAGPDKVVVLPKTQVSLQGSGTDADGTILTQTWSQVSGPNTAVIQSPAAMNTNVTGLIQGTYVFRLVVRDNSSGIGTDDVTVTVKPTGPRKQLIVRPKKV